MKRTVNPPWILRALLLGACFLIGSGCARPPGAGAQPPGPSPPFLPMITEISPYAGGGEPPWIELHNPTEEPVEASGLTLLINDRFEYAFPEGVPALPPGGFLVLHLDGKGEGGEVPSESERVTTLHAPFDATPAMRGRPGQVAVYRRDGEGKDRLVGFVSWGAPGSPKNQTPERHALWRSHWFVERAHGSGDFDPEGLKKADYAIGLYPGRRSAGLEDWMIFPGKDASPGRENVVPRPFLFIPPENAEWIPGRISVAWIANRHARAHRFQVAGDAAFSEPLVDVTLKRPVYTPERALPEGRYFYRVKTVDRAGRESAWSEPRTVVRPKRSPNPGYGCDSRTQETVLEGVVYQNQRKDSPLLCLDGCDAGDWDCDHAATELADDEHGSKNCVRAGISMMASCYNGGRTLSQDRIAFYTEVENVPGGSASPEDDLAHVLGMSSTQAETEALEWALGTTVDAYPGAPSFAQLEQWLDQGRPVMVRVSLFGGFGHVRVIDGYGTSSGNQSCVHVLDPALDARWTTLDPNITHAWVGPVDAPAARSDEASVSTDSDNDGIVDFDEETRFGTGRYDVDTDNDGVHDKEDVRAYVLDAAGAYSKRDADLDGDGARKETDPDNDGDGAGDGCEDANGNGVHEPGLGETDNFDPQDFPASCAGKPVHAVIVFDRSGSMVFPPSDPVKKYDEAAGAAALFLDTWLANDPPPGTEVGLVFYDDTARFDTRPSTDTTLEPLSEGKRDRIVAAFDANRPDHGTTSIGAGLLEATGPRGFRVASLPAEDQDRVLLVLTDGMENTRPRMDDPSVTQALVEGRVNGYVLGIGEAYAVDADRLNALARRLNPRDAALARDMDESDIQKFFLQALAETQGLEFSVDPPGEIAPGETRTHRVHVSEGTEAVTFVVVWHAPETDLRVRLEDPEGRRAGPDTEKTGRLYMMSSKRSPAPGSWTVRISAKRAGASLVRETIPYTLMVLEKNKHFRSRFQAGGGRCRTGDPILLTASLSRDRRPVKRARVTVEATRPRIGLGDLVARVRPGGETPPELPERGGDLRSLEHKTRLISTVFELNDEGVKGDAIPGDGVYSASYGDTRVDGLYAFKFLLRASQDRRKGVVTREGVRSVWVKPRLDIRTSKAHFVGRRYDERFDRTRLRFRLTPMDRYGNRIGPGNEDRIRDLLPASGSRVTDNHDGTYEVEVTRKGRVDPTDVNRMGLFGRPGG